MPRLTGSWRYRWAKKLALYAVAMSTAVSCEENPTAPLTERIAPVLTPSAVLSSWAPKARGPKGVDTRPSADEQVAAELLARSLAEALGEQPIRSAVLRALASSSHPERKLHLASFLGGRGRDVMQAIQRRAGVSEPAIRTAINDIRDLEFYMPVADHRRKWRADEPVMVAVALTEADNPVGFDDRGSRHVFSRIAAPNQPVLTLVPVETDFESQRQLNARGLPERDCTPKTTETLQEAADYCWNSGSTPQGVASARSSSSSPEDVEGIWMTFSRILNGQTGNDCWGDCWAMGDPEYEYHVLGRRTSGAPLDFIQCIGAWPTSGAQPGIRSMDYYYDQNNNFWSGRVKILDAARMDTLNAADNGWAVQVWEDDEGGCQVRGSDWRYIFPVLAGAGFTYWGMTNQYTTAFGEWVYAIIGAKLIGQSLALLIAGGDDYVGTLIDKNQTAWANEWPGNTHAIMDGSTLHGRVTLEIHRTNQPTPVGGTVASVELSSDETMKMPINTTRQLSAYAFDAVAIPVPNRPATWASSNSSVATVSSAGVVNAVGVGTTVITATIDGHSDQTALEVANLGSIASVAVSPSVAYLSQPGETVQLAAHALDANGFEIPASRIQWWSADSSLAMVDQDGVVTAIRGSGISVQVWAELDGVRGSATIELQMIEASISGPTEVNASPSCLVSYTAGGGSGAASYAWETDGDVNADYGDMIQISFPSAGPHFVRLTVSDGMGSVMTQLDVQSSAYFDCPQ